VEVAVSLIRKIIPGLYDGISQQSPTLRSPLQADEQVNLWGTLADGLKRRPPTTHVATLYPNAEPVAKVVHIDRDVANRFIVVLTNGDLRVFNQATGVEVTVNFPVGKGYLTAADPETQFAVVSVADYTFIVNRTVTAQMAVGTPVVTDYRWLGLDTPGIVRQYPPYGAAGTFAGTVQRFEDLPTGATEGQVYKIAGSSDNEFSTYWVQRRSGVWEEARDPSLTQNDIDAATMPHALVRETNGTFTFAPFSWASRRVGDANTNPPPLFIGRKIMDVLFVQNRLGFLADEQTVMSAASDYGNFWRNTLTTYVASDPVTVSPNTAEITLLQYAVPFGDSVMLFAEKDQLKLSWGEAGLSPDSVALTPVTSFQINTKVRPQKLGRDVYFAADSAAHTRVYEYFNRMVNEAAQIDAADITGHVPRYIPSGIRGMAADVVNDAVFAYPGTNGSVYVYKFVWQDATNKIQSAWSKWDFGAGNKVVSVAVNNAVLSLLVQRADGLHLERLSLESGAVPVGAEHEVYLDRRVLVTGVLNEPDGRTWFTLPYKPNQSRFRLVRSSAAPEGLRESLIDPSTYFWVSDNVVSVPGNVTGYAVFGGERFTSTYRFSPQFPEGRDGKVLSGYTVTRTMTLYFTDTAYFRTRVLPYGDGLEAIEEIIPSKLSVFSGKTLGATSLILGRPSYHTGSYTFGVYGRSSEAVVEIINDTHVGSAFQTAEVEMTYHNRAR
jgi:hypothetical protein